MQVYYESDRFYAVRQAASFIRNVHKLAGDSLNKSDMALIDKFLNAAFNEKPPIKHTQRCCWDVNIILNFLKQLGDNKTMLINELGGKVVILILLTTMCRLADIQQLKLSLMAHEGTDLVFTLSEPTKTFTKKTYQKHLQLQRLCIKHFEENKMLCPVLCILDYIKRTEQSCMGVDNVFVIMGPHPREAHVASISRWAKILMNQAGLGDFSVRSARSSSSTCAFMMGMPISDIISHVGWTSEDTFIRKYLKPLGKISSEQLKPVYTHKNAQDCLNDKFSIQKLGQDSRSDLDHSRLV